MREVDRFPLLVIVHYRGLRGRHRHHDTRISAKYDACAHLGQLWQTTRLAATRLAAARLATRLAATRLAATRLAATRLAATRLAAGLLLTLLL